VNLRADELAALVEFLTLQHGVVMQGGDRGGACVESMVKLGALAGLVGQLCS
jgi:hypothetical protein